MNRKQLGDFAENIACFYLKKKGYKILNRNWFFFTEKRKKGEIDIVAKKDKTIHFVEVKALRASGAQGFLPEDKINFQKKEKLKKTAFAWFESNNISPDVKWQIDVISVKLDLPTKKAKIRHFKNVVSS